MTSCSSSPPPPPPPVWLLVAIGSVGSTVAGSTVGGSGVDVGSGGGSVDDVGSGVLTFVFVGTGVDGVTVDGAFVGGTPVGGTPVDGISVFLGVRITGVSGTNVDGTVGVPVPAPGTSGHRCSLIGNSKQLVVSTQTFRVNEAFWAPRQSRMRRPSISLALKQVTPVSGSATWKNAWLDMINTA